MLATLALVSLLVSAAAQGPGGHRNVAHSGPRGVSYPVVPHFEIRSPVPAGIGGAHYAQAQKAAGGHAYAVARDMYERDPAGIGGAHYAQAQKVGDSRVYVVGRDNYERDAAGRVMYDERGIPITATTTVVVPMTTTQVVWVDGTTSAPSPSATESVSSAMSSGSFLPPFTANSNIVLPPEWAESTSSGTTSTWATESSTGSATLSPSPSASPSTSPSPEVSSEASSSPSASPTASTTVSPSPTSLPPGNGNQGLNRRLMNGYWADWTANIIPPESIDWSRFDVINYAFAIPTSDGRLEFTLSNSASLLRRLVASAHGSGKKVVLSVGGWTGSAFFSSIVADSRTSQVFINSIVAAINEYQLDGIDLDWEYPGVPGAGGNTISPDDSANYLIFLRKLRQAVPQNSLITAATQVWPFAGPDGRPMSDVSAFAEVFDWILLMNYDIWGSASSPGPNAPLADGCKDSSQPTANAYGAVASWVAAGFPASKITLGVAAYGYVQRSTASSLKHRAYPPPNRRQSVTVKNGDGGSSDGQVTFRGLVQQGALSRGNFEGAGGFTRNWDECSSTPWLASASAGQIVTYDDPQSLNMKGQFAAQAGIRGCSMWSVDGDFIDGSWPLTDAVRSGMGI